MYSKDIYSLSQFVIGWLSFCRACEENLKKEFEESLSNVKADHAQDKQEMLSEFSEAQELLKEKITTLQLK